MENTILVLLALGIVALLGYVIFLTTKTDDKKPDFIIKKEFVEDPYRYWTWAADWRRPVSWRRRWH